MKTIGWEMYEAIAIGLPNIYQCKKCKRLVNYLGAPYEICYECRGEKPRFEKIQNVK